MYFIICFFQTRCPVCFKHFCCSAHRSEHQVKIHTETFAQKHNDHSVQVFQKNVRTSLFWAQNNQKINKILKQSQVRQVSTVPLRLPVSKNIQLPSVKRLHSEIDKRILSTSVTTVVSQQRRILVPVHRLELPNVLKDDNTEVSLKDSNEVRKEPSYVDKSVKTSTPILSPLPNHQPSQMIWDISSESTISNYQTPSGSSPGSKTETNQSVKSSKNQVMVTPLRGIILKSSKYDSDSDTGPSPAINSSKSRRVTFSSSSQVSSTSSPLESIQEVEIYEEIENTYNHIEDISAKFRKRRTEDTESEKFTKFRKVLEDSTPPIQHNGFLSCVTNMFCSAIYTIPSLAPWRKTDENDLMLNRSKRSRSPDARETHYLDVGTPLLKRPCYTSDLRKNPIQSRRPIYKI